MMASLHPRVLETGLILVKLSASTTQTGLDGYQMLDSECAVFF